MSKQYKTIGGLSMHGRSPPCRPMNWRDSLSRRPPTGSMCGRESRPERIQFVDRITLEIKLNRDRAWLLETMCGMTPEVLLQGVTLSEHDPTSTWTPQDHLAHLAGIEKTFNRMIGRHLAGDANPVGLRTGDDGQPRSREAIMAGVHAMTEAWVQQHRGKS